MHVVVAPQEFKGSLTATAAAHAMTAGVRRALPDATIDEAPVSDGGAGLVDALLGANGGELLHARAHDPLMRPMDASWALLPGVIGVIEAAAASGLVLVAPGERDPLAATTFGTGELIGAALDAGCRTIIVGVGGSATVDAGGGALQALGARLLDADGNDVAHGGAALANLVSVDCSSLDSRLRGSIVRVACDVRNVLYGPEGAAVVFGPQKGASAEQVARLDAALHHFADVVKRDSHVDLSVIEGTGAAGGLGAGLLACGGATLEPGFPLVAEAIGLRERIASADLVLTGEGRLDSQTAYGKAPAGVADLARSCGKPVLALAGSIGDYDASSCQFDLVDAASPEGVGVEEAMRRARELVAEAAFRIVRAFTR